MLDSLQVETHGGLSAPRATKVFGVVRHAMHGTAVTAPKPWPGAVAWVDAMRATVGKGTLRQLLAGEKNEGEIE